MSAGRQYYLALHLLDRQLVDRQGRFVGKVDDLDLERGETGSLYVTAIRSGPGVLTRRLGGRVLGPWLERAHRLLGSASGDGDGDDRGDPARLPFSRVADIGSAVELAAEQEELPTQSSHRWVAEHVLGHVPGSRGVAGE
jgi:sporulation protein YlmC with PRC-barrel domain